MNQLFIEIEINKLKQNEPEVFITIPSFVALYMFNFLDKPENVTLHLVSSSFPFESGKLKLRTNSLEYVLIEEKIISKENCKINAIRDLRLPVFSKQGDKFIAGMCAVCRELIACNANGKNQQLLGFKESCLLAPSEASIWTRFCEVNVVQSLSKILKGIEKNEIYTVMPVECARFEKHMNEPVRMHNIYKMAREKANIVDGSTPGKMGKNKIKIECSVPKEHLAIEHTFAEGVEFTIADLILYPCMRLIYHCFPKMLEHFPLTNLWFNQIDLYRYNCHRILAELCLFPRLNLITESVVFKIPDCDDTSLYKSDPKRYKPRNRIFTDQREVNTTLNKLKTLGMKFDSYSPITYGQSIIDWQSIEPTHAESSSLPQERLQRKRQQLENLANAVSSITRDGQRIIDFCSGTGHLGILLALKLPRCEIILMENKAISLQKAKERTKDLNLKNITFYQCNIDYFEGNFDIGTSLHACGTATDIVLHQCHKARANFVCCPCCYGTLQPMPHIKYPLSETFRKLLSEKEFMYIAHAADQAHALGTLNCKPETIQQGLLCMDIVDTDRKLQAEEAGYEVILTRLEPENCTPKNRLLVGRLLQKAKIEIFSYQSNLNNIM